MTPKPKKRAKAAQETIQPEIPSILGNKKRSTQEIVQSGLKAVELLVLAAFSSPISQLSLSPVYGSIPSSIYHQRLTMVTVLAAWILKDRIRPSILWHMISLLPVIAFSIPTIQYILFQYSGLFGPVYGPLLTEILTYCPLVFVSVQGAAELFDAIDLNRYGEHVTTAGPGIVSYAILSVSEKFSNSFIQKNIGSSLIFTRFGLQFVVSTIYSMLLPSKFLALAILPLLHTLSFNVHSSLQQNTAVLNATLHGYGYSLVARQESVTGYISVIDSSKNGFRLMRCDHSLLGGVWFPRPEASVSALKDPIYTIFIMLEAVRLVVVDSAKGHIAKLDNEKQALVIGLGVGTAPSALIAHGINTTIVEIDPVVHKFATQYFDLPSRHASIIEDAAVFIDRSEAAGVERQLYDYIIHDVFTGGAEPIELFTAEFLQGLSNMLTAEGVIAINYAGDLLLPSANIIIHTIKSIFPTCRLYRENPPPLERDNLDRDFTNMIIFCRKSVEVFAFRKPVEADYLGSQFRKYEMLPKNEIDTALFDTKIEDREIEILRRGHTKKLEAFHRKSAVGHWRVMRTVLPDEIWNNW